MTWLLAVFALWIALMAPAMRSRQRCSGSTLHRRQRNYLRLENLLDPVIPDVKAGATLLQHLSSLSAH